MKLILSYLQGHEQCVNINNIQSNLLDIISGVPQGSTLGPILFNNSINNYFTPYDSTLSAWTRTTSDVIKLLESESNNAVGWSTNNYNLGKLQAIILDNKKSDFINKQLVIDNQQIKTVSNVEFLGIQLDDNLNFNPHISVTFVGLPQTN